MLLRQCVARSYADYGSENHRWHIGRLFVVFKAVLCAAIFTKSDCRRPVYVSPLK